MRASDLDAELRSFGLRSQACCEDCVSAADKARQAKEEDEGNHHGAPDHIRQAMRLQHDKVIAEHDRMAMAHARRHDYAALGFLIDGPDERMDADHTRRHSQLIAAAGEAGRIRHLDQYDDGDEGSA